ncbi:hypothetical protein ACQSMD_16465 [Streptomyces flavovirens]|uniref:hypothetical protein n=1 Tax=Streptomyces flavovirens TaxID=52258 RepID=UPI003D099581
MSDDKPIALEGIPVFTGNLATLDTKVTELTSAAETIATTTGDVHSSFGGLQAFYQAPEAEQLFATTKPVVDTGQKMKSDLTTISRALSTYSDEVYPLVEKLKEIKRDAGAFLVKINADDKWREDGDLIDENNHRRDEIADTLAAFQDAEITCHNKIVALVCGVPLKKSDGSDSAHQYGFDAETYKHAEGLPWGDPLVESIPGWQVWEHAWEFTKGFFVDGVWGTIKGLGTLVGFDGFDAAGQAWKGLAQLATGVAISLSPVAAVQFWTADEKDMPGWLRDSRNAVKETGKALVAWDQWGDNPSRAAGAVTFNVVTTVFTGGTGAAASGAGKTALAAKALSAAGKVGRIVDPMTYVFKGAGVGLSKIGDVMAGLKGLGKIEIPPLPDNVFTLPDGWTRLPDGTLDVPAGATLPEGATRLPDGAVKLPEGTIALPPNTLKSPFDEGSAYADIDGNLYDEHGNLVEKGANARKEQGKTADPNTPDHTHLETPVRQPVLVGAGARVGDVGRVGDNLPGGGIPDRSPGGVANNMPSNSLDTHGGTGRPGDGTAGGGANTGHHHGGGSDTPSANTPDSSHGGTSHPGSTNGTTTPRQSVPRPSFMHEGTNPYGPPASRTLDKIEEIQVYRANEEPGYFEHHYRKDGTRKSLEVYDESGFAPPQLTRLSENSPWIRAKDAPAPHPPYYLDTGYTKVGADKVTDSARIKILDEAARDRYLAIQRDNLAADWKAETGAAHAAQKTPESAAAWQQATDAYKESHAAMGDAAEKFGEKAAEYHHIAQNYTEFEKRTLLGPKNGNDQFDQLWTHEDGRVVVVEAKSSPGTELGRRTLPNGKQVSQGSREYFLDIMRVMAKRGETESVQAVKDAMREGKLEYIVVKGGKNEGAYNGYQYRRFDITKRTLPSP